MKLTFYRNKTDYNKMKLKNTKNKQGEIDEIL
jgi:hypothetical protein